MKPDDFYGSPSGKVIRAPGGYFAFIPNPLPPTIVYSPRVVLALSEADRIVGQLTGLSNTLPNPFLLVHPMARQEAVLSSRIEGTRASLDDLFAYEAFQLPLFESGADVREVHNYVRALEYGLERLKTLPVSLRLIREIHGRLMEGVRGEFWTPGEFRRSQNWIGPPGSTIENAMYIPPPMDEMECALNDLEQFLHTSADIPALIRLGLVHYQFEAIHPFLDGNGRVGRLLIVLLLSAWKVLPQPLLYLSAFFEVDRPAYYAGLLGVSQRGAWEDWLVYFLKGVTAQGTQSVQKINGLLDLQKDFHQRLQSERAMTRLVRLVDYLFMQPILTARQVEKALGVNFPAAQRYIARLEALGMVEEITGQARNRIYRANAILGVLSER